VVCRFAARVSLVMACNASCVVAPRSRARAHAPPRAPPAGDEGPPQFEVTPEQDAFIKAWKALGNFKGDSSFYTWIYRVAYNTCLNHLKTRRHRTHHVSLNDLDQNAEHDPGLVELISQNTPRREASLAELQKSLNDAMLKLSEEHRTVVVLHDVQGLPHDEIAKIMGCNPGTVRSRLFYARQQLQAWLSDLRK
jgi:RNA polymerase sigma-70 factor (ECF subfamily)